MSRESQEFDIDLSVGETSLVSEELKLELLLKEHKPHLYPYQKVGGLPSLVKYLEDRHQSHIVVGVGAKQIVHACFQMMKSQHKTQVNVVHPYWNVFRNTFEMYPFKVSDSFEKNPDSFNFIVSPNNPDGQIFPYIFENITNNSRSSIDDTNLVLDNITVHDSVYNLDYYTDTVYNIGELQIYSCSKTLGMSGARIGYCTTSNIEYKNYISAYIEEVSVGASSFSQELVLEAFQVLDKTDTSGIKTKLLSNKKKIVQALQSYGDFKVADGIFVYGKLHKPLPENVIVAHYMDDHVRINACVNESKIDDFVTILNNHL